MKAVEPASDCSNVWKTVTSLSCTFPMDLSSGQVNLVGAVAAGAALAVSTWRASREAQDQPQTVPLLATTGAFVFAAQMLNFPIGGGTSGHFLGAAAVTALLGPWRACLVMALVVTLQALVFNDGGLTALGTNVCNMAVIGCFGSYLVMRMLRVVLPGGRTGYLAAASLAGWASVMAASAACAVELATVGDESAVPGAAGHVGNACVDWRGRGTDHHSGIVRRDWRHGPTLCLPGRPWVTTAGMQRPPRHAVEGGRRGVVGSARVGSAGESIRVESPGWTRESCRVGGIQSSGR